MRDRTVRFGRCARSFAIAPFALLVFALLPAAARAAEPVANNESVQIANPTTVTLEAIAPGETELTFAIASDPTIGSLGQVSSPTCQPTGTGSTDCTATVTYTPNQCANGPDSFTYTATDVATTTTSSPATVTLGAGSSAAKPPPSPALPQIAVTTAGASFTGAVQGAVAGATVDYGDNSGVRPLVVDPSGGAPLSHVYAAEGSYALTATNHAACGLTAAASERIDVLPAGALRLSVATAPPGGSATITVPGPPSLAATLTVSPTDQSPGAGIVGATYPATNPPFASAGPPGEVFAGYDVRSITASAHDRAVVTFTYADRGVTTSPTLVYFDSSTDTFVPVRASTLVPNSLVVDAADHRITTVLDNTSFPKLTGLTGTPFAVIARPPTIGGLAVTPRCVAPSAIRSLRIRLTLSEHATLQIRVHRLGGVRAPHRCGEDVARSTPPGHRVLRLGRHPRPGVYRVSVIARNVYGRSGVASATFALADS